MAVLLQRNRSQAPPDDRRVRYRADIQGLRAIAVLAVVANHMAGWPTGSFVGVDVFFVISGYLITGILVREFEKRQTISFRGFYARRIKRILPAGLFVIGATVCVTRVLAGIDRYHFAAKDAIAAVLFAANWHFAQTGVNYFNQSLPPSPLQHYWSLSVEEQFYFVWPWLMLGLLLIGVRLRFWRHEHARPVAGVAIAVLSAISLTWAFAETAHNPTAAYFSSFARAWELGLGALVAIAAEPIARCDARLRLAVACAGLVGVLASLFVVPSSPGFPAPWALLPTLSAAAVLGAGAGLSGRSMVALTNPVSQYVGKISYSLYLWHFPVVVLIVTVVPQYSVAYWLAGLALIFGLSAATFHLLEDPARRGTWFRQRAGRIPAPALGWLRYAAACAITVAVAGAGLLIVRAIESDEICARSAGPDRTYAGRPAQLHRGGSARPPPSMREAQHWRPSRAVARPTPRGHGRRLRLLRVPTTAHPPVRLRKPATRCDPGCARGRQPRRGAPSRPRATAERAQLARHRVHRTDMWMASRRALARLPRTSPDPAGTPPRPLRGRHRNRAARVHQLPRAPPQGDAPVAAAGAQIVVVEDDPSVSPASTACVARVSYSPTGGCGTPVRIAYRDPDRLAQAAERIPGAHVVRTRRFYCRDGYCPATIGNVLVYRDTAAHVTASYARTLSPYLVEAIEAALPAALH